jgi:hypothetical protein
MRFDALPMKSVRNGLIPKELGRGRFAGMAAEWRKEMGYG